MCAAEVREWADGLVEVGELIAARFARSEPRASAVCQGAALGGGAEELLDALGARRPPGSGPDAAAALDRGLGTGRAAG